MKLESGVGSGPSNNGRPLALLLELLPSRLTHHWVKHKGESPKCIKKPLSDDAILRHLSGGPSVGCCPIARGDNTVRVAVLDLDSHGGETDWQSMAALAQRICDGFELAAGLLANRFRSSGGSGVHLIFVWDEPQDARSVRNLFSALLAGLGLRVGARGVAAHEVEVFPKQDHVPLDGYGNMFVLPLSRNSTALGATWEPMASSAIQWQVSSSVTLCDPTTPRHAAVVGGPTDAVDTLTNEQVKDVRSALVYLDHDDRDVWSNLVAHALRRYGRVGWELFVEFSRRSEKYDEADARRVWNSIRLRTEIGCRSIFAAAARRGWVNPKKGSAPPPQSDAERIAQIAAGSHSAADLLVTTFDEIVWVVEKLLPEGVFILASAPKIGKSWFALQLAIAVASGGAMLGQQAICGAVLYLALEDTPRRLKKRLEKLHADMLLEATAAARLHFKTSWSRVSDDGGVALEQWLAAHPGTRLLVVDVFERFRPPRSAKGNPYAEDYEAMKVIKGIAEKHQLTALVVHHTRKSAAEDPLDTISGTQGLAGAADGVLVLKRSRGVARGELHVIGRDLEEEGCYTVDFDKATCQWAMVGGRDIVTMTEGMDEIREALKKMQKPASDAELAAICGKKRTAVANQLARLCENGLVKRTERGKYECT